MKLLMRSIKEVIIVEFKTFLREPIGVFFALLFPILLLLLFGTIFGSDPAMPGFKVIDFYVPALMSMIIGTVGLMGIPIAISSYREYGILKRYRVSPISLSTFLSAHIAVQFILSLVSSLLIVVVAELVFDIRFAGNPFLVALAFIVSTIPTFAIGFALGGIFSSVRTTQAVGSAIFFPMMFTSGMAMPRHLFPEWLQSVTEYLPFTRMVDLITGMWIGVPLIGQLISLEILIITAIIAFLFAKLTFKWSAE
jgi:ABC-2 type transport system permease protein